MEDSPHRPKTVTDLQVRTAKAAELFIHRPTSPVVGRDRTVLEHILPREKLEGALTELANVSGYSAVILLCMVVNDGWIPREDLLYLMDVARESRGGKVFPPWDPDDNMRHYLQVLRERHSGPIYTVSGRGDYIDSFVQAVADSPLVHVLESADISRESLHKMAVVLTDSLIVLGDLVVYDEGSGQFLLEVAVDGELEGVISENVRELGVDSQRFWNFIRMVSVSEQTVHHATRVLEPQLTILLCLGGIISPAILGRDRYAAIRALFSAITGSNVGVFRVQRSSLVRTLRNMNFSDLELLIPSAHRKK